MHNSQHSATLVVVGMVTPKRVFVISGIDGHDGHERWRFELEHDQLVPSTALAADHGLVYAATTKGLVYALRAEDGSLAWQHQVTTLARYPPPINLRVVAGGGTVVVDYSRPDIAPIDSRRITALDGQNGTQRWVVHPATISPWLRMWRVLRRSTMEERTGFVLLGAYGNEVYVTEAFDRSHPHPDLRRTVLLDPRTGKRRWTTLRASAANFAGHWGSRTTLTVVGGTAYTVDTHLSALEAASGRVRWSHPRPSGEGIRPGPLVANDSVVCAAYDARFCVYRALDGELLWQLMGRDQRTYLGSFLGMVLIDDAVYVGRTFFGQREFVLEARDALTGELRWEWPHSDSSRPGALPVCGDLSWRVVGAGGILYVPGYTTLYGVRASDGEQLWELPNAGDLSPLVALSE
jgi:outer membrane protein assembly factor BamB